MKSHPPTRNENREEFCDFNLYDLNFHFLFFSFCFTQIQLIPPGLKAHTPHSTLPDHVRPHLPGSSKSLQHEYKVSPLHVTQPFFSLLLVLVVLSPKWSSKFLYPFLPHQAHQDLHPQYSVDLTMFAG